MDSSESLSPGNFSQIHLRLWDTWAQISLTSTKTRLRGSLNPDIIEEITHALGYVASVPRCVVNVNDPLIALPVSYSPFYFLDIAEF